MAAGKCELLDLLLDAERERCSQGLLCSKRDAELDWALPSRAQRTWESLPTFEFENDGFVMVTNPRKRTKLVQEEAEEASSSGPAALPHELVEKIVASIPYPHILNARLLSKAWSCKLSGLQSENLVFEKAVKSTSCQWPSYFPLVFNRRTDFISAFDRTSKRWTKIFYQLKDQVPWQDAGKFSGEGSLICCLTQDSRIFVSNLFTRRWRWLPERPLVEESPHACLHMIPDGDDHYRVLIISSMKRSQVANLYHSRTNSWSVKTSRAASYPVDANGVYLNGVVYFTFYNIEVSMLEVWAYNIAKGTWHAIPHPLLLMTHTFRTFKLLLCGDQLILVFRLQRLPSLKRLSLDEPPAEGSKIRMNSMLFFRLDPVTEQFSEIHRGPEKTLPGASASLFASHGDSIIFGKLRKRVEFLVEFNVRSKRWSCLPSSTCVDYNRNLSFSSFAFNPSRNPYIVP